MRGNIIAGNISESYDSSQLYADPMDINVETVSFDFGAIHGTRKSYYFDGGAIFHIKAFAVKDYRLQAEHDALVKLHFCLNGERKSGIPADHQYFHTRMRQHNVYYFKPGNGYIDFCAGQEMEFVDICLDASLVQRLFTAYPLAFPELLDAIRHQRFFQLSPAPLPITAAIHTQLTDILHCNVTRRLKRAFFDNKLLGLLLLQLEQAQHKAPACRYSSPHDLEKLEAARTLLITQHASPPSLRQLARQVGINDHKLKRGFRELYHNTVMGYLTDYKMGLAHELLSSGNYSISDVCYKLGYKSVAHFSRLFKKKCSMSPSQLKSRH
ncbi:helix-turn-helix transcriptional regulator [Chitinophaga vietnamensis]|uniref:helix-turn-helix transcriptional regulator n=1 Tax=Chitinophaga vietnamensis TaxID=2593957 RepID=UPI00117829C5|nr:AraC family transcriptional regulator [Chitinophaga vietnamensis]